MADAPYKGGPVSSAFQNAYAPLYRAFMAESDHTNRAILDVRMEKAMNPRGLPARCMSALINEDRCPNCLGELDTGWECNSCGYDATPWMAASKAINDAAHDRREA